LGVKPNNTAADAQDAVHGADSVGGGLKPNTAPGSAVLPAGLDPPVQAEVPRHGRVSAAPSSTAGLSNTPPSDPQDPHTLQYEVTIRPKESSIEALVAKSAALMIEDTATKSTKNHTTDQEIHIKGRCGFEA
jgi:hypothetical protein